MKSFLLVLISIFTLGCSSMGNFFTGVDNASPYFRSSAAIITGVVLQKAVSEEDRHEKAEIVFKVATAIEALTAEGVISVETLNVIVSSNIPDKPHWKEFGTAIVLLYADFYEQTAEARDNVKERILKDALNKIAAGCKIAAQSVLTR